MENITITIAGQKLQDALDKAAEELFKSSYDNPIAKMLKAAVEAKEGEIKKVIDEVITQAMTNPELKTRIADVVISRMVEGALKR